MTDIDRKYMIDAINPCSGSIHTEKDAVLFLAKDKAFLEGALPGYRAKCIELGANPAHIESIDLLIQRVATYQRLMESKVPDTDLPCEIRRCVDGINVEPDINSRYENFLNALRNDDVVKLIGRLTIDIIDRYYSATDQLKDYVCKMFDVLTLTTNFSVVKVSRLLLLDIKMSNIASGSFKLSNDELDHINSQLSQMVRISVK